MASLPSQAAESSSAAMRVKTPSKYSPCVRAANELDPIAISHMEPETHHRGKRTVILLIEPAKRSKRDVLSIVQDEEEELSLLQLFNQPSDIVVPAEQLLRAGRCYLIKEPFLQVSANGLSSLRVDHPGDIVLLSHDHELHPAKWRMSERAIGESYDVRMKGNDAVSKKKWALANNLYTTAIEIAKTAEESKLAYLNRSLANLQLGRPAAALADAIKSSGADDSEHTEKGLFREASALYHLRKFDQCLDRLQKLKTAYPASSSAVPMIDRVQARLREQQSGQYNFRHMHEQAKATPPLIDCASYTMPVEIRDSPGKGRGVFTTTSVLAGQLLICEKAFGYTFLERHPGDKEMTEKKILADLHGLIVQKLSDNIEDARSFGKLYHGDYDAVSVYEVDGRPVVDSFLVEEVVRLTSFGSSRISLSQFRTSISSISPVNSSPDDSIAVGNWSFISHMNHSCIGNASASHIGDMMIIRATKDLEEGSELFFSYEFPHDCDSYDEAQERLNKWGFICDCALCLDRKATTNKMLMQRKSILRDLSQFVGPQPQSWTSVSNIQKMLEKLDQSYSNAARSPGGVRRELWAYYIRLGRALIEIERPSDAIEMTLRGLEAMGFIICASPPRGHPKSRGPQLLIKQWGVGRSDSIMAFLYLHQAYKKLASPLSAVARKYMETAYSIAMGEKDTILDTFPQIA